MDKIRKRITKSKLARATGPIWVLLLSLLLGITASWLIKDGVALLVLNGKSFNNRSFFVQTCIVVFLVVFTSVSFFLILSIFDSSYSGNEKLQSVKKIVFNSLNKETKIRDIAAIILIGFSVSVFFHYFMGLYLNLPYPYNTFLFSPNDKFADFFILYDTMQYRQPYIGNHLSAQFPFLNLICYGFRILPRVDSLIVYTLLFLCAFITFTVLYTYAGDYKKHISELFIISLLSYPILFTIDRGNLESLLLISLLAFVYFYQKKKYLLSVAFLSFAIAMKLFPVVFLVIYLSDKKYKEVFLAGLFTGLLTFFSLLFFKGGFLENLTLLVSGANLVPLNRFLGTDLIVQRGVSLFTLIKIFFIETNLLQKVDMVKFLGIYVKTAIIVFLFIAAYVVFWEKDFWKKNAILVIAMLLLPQVSADYKLIHIFVPLFLFINAPRPDRLDWIYISLFGLLLIPKDYYLLSRVISDAGVADISISVIINYIALITMLLLIIGTGLKNRISPEKEAAALDAS